MRAQRSKMGKGLAVPGELLMPPVDHPIRMTPPHPARIPKKMFRIRRGKKPR